MAENYVAPKIKKLWNCDEDNQ